MEISAEHRSNGGGPVDLQVASATLNDLLLERPDTETFLRRIAELAVAIVPGTRCSVTFQPDRAELVAGVDGSGIPADSRQQDGRARHGHVDVEDAGPGDGPDSGAGGGVSLALTVDGVAIGTLSLYAGGASPLDDADLDRARSFAHQAAATLVLLVRDSAQLVLDEQLQEALVTRTVIDQAMGVLMHARQISGRRALKMLRRLSQTSNRKVSVLAAELIVKMTGHPPEPPRPLTRRPGSPHHLGDDGSAPPDLPEQR